MLSKERWPGGQQGEEVQALQGWAGQAAVQGLNQPNQAQYGQGYQLKYCPCPKYGLSLLNLFLKAGQASTN